MAQDQVKNIIWQFNYAHHVTGPFCDDNIQQQKLIHGGHYLATAGLLLGQKS